MTITQIHDVEQVTPTILDTPTKVLKYIQDNFLDHIWTNWSNPTVYPGKHKSIRFNAYTPQYTDTRVNRLHSKCKSTINKTEQNPDGEPCAGYIEVPFTDKQRHIIKTIQCPVCNTYQDIMYRWISSVDQTKLYLQSKEHVQHYSQIGRSFFATLITYKPEAQGPQRNYGNESLITSMTLAIDIDNKTGHTIVDPITREKLQKTIDIVKEELNTFVPNSYNIQTSGNGINFLLHHRLTTQNVLDTAARFDNFIDQTLIPRMKKADIHGIQIDSLNGASRVFKMLGSPHQRYDLVAIPIQTDDDLTKMTTDEFKLKNFNIKRFINGDNQLLYYNHFDDKDITSLYTYLLETTDKHPNYGARAKRYVSKESMAATLNDDPNNIKDEDIQQTSVNNVYPWTTITDIQTPGKIDYKTTITKSGKKLYRIRIRDPNPDQKFQEFKQKFNI